MKTRGQLRALARLLLDDAMILIHRVADDGEGPSLEGVVTLLQRVERLLADADRPDETFTGDAS